MFAHFILDSMWLVTSQTIVIYKHAQAGENPELRTLFYRLAYLARLPCLTAVFVFDGPGRPTRKRNKQVIKSEHSLACAFREFIEAFGFAHRMVRRTLAPLSRSN